MQPRGPLSLTILVVEDEVDLRDAISDALRVGGHRLVEVDTVARARDPSLGAVDVMILDLVVSGGTTEESLAQFAPEVATVLTTADATARSAAIAAKYAVPLLLKPFDIDDWLQAVLRAHEQRTRAGV